MRGKNTAKKDSRNYGIDLLRLISMFFVMVLHSLLASRMLDAPEGGNLSGQYMAAWLLETLCFGAVNIFAIISGYVGYREEARPLKIKRLLSIWGQTVFYCLVIFALIRLRRPDVATREVFWSCLMPVTHKAYWYLSAFVLLFFAMPILNAGVRSFTDKQCKRALLVIMLLMSFTTLFAGDIFYSINGYSFLWIASMYLIGAIMKKMSLLASLKIRWCLLGYLGLSLIAWAIKMFGIDFSFAGFAFYRDSLVSFCSPLIVLASMLLVSAFSKLKVPKKASRIIAFFAPCAFAAYILNSAPMASFFIPKLFGDISNIALPLKLVHTVLFAITFFVGAILIDRIRLSVTTAVVKKVKK